MNSDTTRRRFLLATTGTLAGISFAGADEKKALEQEDPHGRPLGWAIAGLGALALGQILPAFKDMKLGKPVALVSGHPDKAAQVAAKYGIEPDAIYDYENYDRIAADPRIDIVYIVLPNSMHAEFTIRALKAGKHVFCEKPMAVSAEEGASMAAAADTAGKKLGIAYRLHYEPLTRQAMQWCQEQKFGPIRTFNSSNCQNVEVPNIRLNAALGGGPLGDIGIYSINAARFMIGEEPVEVSAFMQKPSDDPRFKEVPQSVVFSLRYPSGALATCDCSFASAESRRFEIHCAKGIIRMENAFAYQGLKLSAKDQSGEIQPPEGQTSVNQFAAEMEAFNQAILENGEVRTTAALGIADIKIIAALNESAASGKPVKTAI